MLGTKPNKDFPYFSAAWKKTNKGLSGLKLEDGNNTSITIWEFGNPREELLKSETNKKIDFSGVCGAKKGSFLYLCSKFLESAKVE